MAAPAPLDELEPDVVHAHYLLRWPYVASLIDRRPLVATPWGSDLYVATGDDRRRAEYVLRHAWTWWLPAHPICGASCVRAESPSSGFQQADLGGPGPIQPATRAAESRTAGDPELPRRHRALQPRPGAGRLSRRPAAMPDATLALLHGDAPLAERVQVRLDELVGMASCRSPRAFRTRRWPTTHVARRSECRSLARMAHRTRSGRPWRPASRLCCRSCRSSRNGSGLTAARCSWNHRWRRSRRLSSTCWRNRSAAGGWRPTPEHGRSRTSTSAGRRLAWRRSTPLRAGRGRATAAGPAPVPVEPLPHGGPSSPAHRLGLCGMGEQVLDRRSDGCAIARIGHQPAAPSDDDLAPAWEVGRDHRSSGCHVLEQLVRANRVHVIRLRMERTNPALAAERLRNISEKGCHGMWSTLSASIAACASAGCLK